MKETTEETLWRYLLALDDAIDALSEPDAPLEKLKLIKPLHEISGFLMDVIADSRAVNGKRPRRFMYRMMLIRFAAAVTVLKNGRHVEDVIAEVAIPNGVDCKELRNMRDRLHRGRADEASAAYYAACLADFEAMPKAEIMFSLEGSLGKLCT